MVVISGTQKGKTGTILSVDVEKSRAIVEGVNLVSKHSRPSTENPKGGIVKKKPVSMCRILWYSTRMAKPVV